MERPAYLLFTLNPGKSCEWASFESLQVGQKFRVFWGGLRGIRLRSGALRKCWNLLPALCSQQSCAVGLVMGSVVRKVTSQEDPR